MLTQTIFKVTIETYEAGAYRRVAKGFRNPRRVRDAPLRISFLTLAVLLFFPIVLCSAQPPSILLQHFAGDLHLCCLELFAHRADNGGAVPPGMRSAPSVHRMAR